MKYSLDANSTVNVEPPVHNLIRNCLGVYGVYGAISTVHFFM
jgi:hypothetical protein